MVTAVPGVTYRPRMKRWWLAGSLVIASLGPVACSDPDPHAVVDCKGYLDNTGAPFVGKCEAACQTAGSNGAAPTGKGAPCTARHGAAPGGQVINCGATLDTDGVTGCCSTGIDGAADVEFFTCL